LIVDDPDAPDPRAPKMTGTPEHLRSREAWFMIDPAFDAESGNASSATGSVPPAPESGPGVAPEMNLQRD
jgi:hypothetical protein